MAAASACASDGPRKTIGWRDIGPDDIRSLMGKVQERRRDETDDLQIRLAAAMQRHRNRGPGPGAFQRLQDGMQRGRSGGWRIDACGKRKAGARHEQRLPASVEQFAVESAGIGIPGDVLARGWWRTVVQSTITIASVTLLGILIWYGIDLVWRIRFQTWASLDFLSMGWAYAAIPVGAFICILGVVAHQFDPIDEQLDTAQ